MDGEDALSPDETKLLSLIPEKTSKGNNWLRKQLQWDPGRYLEARDRLVKRKLVSLGTGRGGSVRRSEPTSAASDETKLLSLVPEDGTSVGNKWLRERLGWDDAHYSQIRQALIASGILKKGRGQGGSVFRSVSPDVRPKKRVKEAGLYVPVEAALRSNWSSILRHRKVLAQITAHAGRRDTGGKYTRPDITFVACDTYSYVPGKFLEVITIEVKPAGIWDISGVFEAASHSSFANQSFLLIHCPDGRSEVPPKHLERLEKECLRFGIGLGLFADPEKYESYDWRVDADRRQPDPGETDQFIEKQLSKENKLLIADWMR